jgi:hypothetical protein
MADWSVILHASAVLREHDLTEHQGRLAQALERGAALDACRAGTILGEAVCALLARRLDAVARQPVGHDAIWADIAALRAARQALDGLACDRVLAEPASVSMSQPALEARRMAWEATLQREREALEREREALATDPALAAQPALLDRLRGILDPRVCRLFVLGNVKRGKSTLINALLGTRLLPSRVTPATAVLCTLRHADTLQITAHFGDGRPSAVLSPADLENHFACPLSPIAQRLAPGAYPLAAVDIELPWPLLQAGLQVIDTPGLNESSERTASIRAAINAADILFYVLSATEPLSADELETIDGLWRDGHRTILFVVNYADRVDLEDLPVLRERFVRLLGAYGPPDSPLPLFLVAARPALLAQVRGDAAALAASGLLALRAALERLAEPLEIAPLRRARLRQLCCAARTAEAEAAAAVARAIAALARAEDDMRLLAARASAAERAQSIAERNAAHERAVALLATYRAGAGRAIKGPEPATSTNRPSSLRSAAAELRAAQSALDAAARQGEDIRAAARDALADAARLDATILGLQGALLEG